MPPNEIQYGEAMRYMISNNIKHKMTHRREITSILKTGRVDYQQALAELNSRFISIGLEMHPCSTDQLDTSDTFFLVRDQSIKTDEEIEEFLEKLIIAVTIIYIENKKMSLEVFTNILSKLMGNEKAESLIFEMKKHKYVKVEKEDIYVIKLYWRFYAEFPYFDPLEFFEKTFD
ncbi:hypothetical protein H312_01070 [Anncaliia algerae PRA339]|uniref:MAGE domain-containing protein n=1 Tax=Anncaliia algerae PRA339 TaxID=1288291 RepID=A0A059F316_9MICR|nr:hypothetical protein H312_01070 [Anncaliia algerae PRA339]